MNVPISASHIGVRIRLVGGTDPTAACGQLYTECYDLASGNGVVHIRGWSSATAPSVGGVGSSSGTCAPDAYFAAADCSAGVQAEVDLGATHAHRLRRDDGGLGDRRRRGEVPADAGGSSGLVTWTLGSGVPLSGGGPHNVGLRWSFEQTTGVERQDLHEQEQQPVQGLGLARGRAARVRRVGGSSGFERVQISGPSVTSGANSFQQGTTQTLGVSIAVKGNLQIQSQASDPVIELRVVGSQNQSIDCDPDFPNLRDEIENGCEPTYKINPSFSCPAYNALWGLPSRGSA